MECESLMRRRLYDLMTYIIETVPSEKHNIEFAKITMTKNEYDHPELIPWGRLCELVWIMEKYIEMRDDEDELNDKKYIKFKEICIDRFPNIEFLDDKGVIYNE